MSDTPAWLHRVVRCVQWVLCIALVVWSARIAIDAAFAQFHTYDDEGYVLLSLVNYLKHGSLYDLVYTQYGPFFYQLYSGLSSLIGFELTNTTARYLTTINWILSCVVCASIAQRLTRRWLWWPVCFIVSFVHLRISTDEPMHPGSLTCLLWVFAVWLVVPGARPTRPLLRAFALGLVATALLFTKINVGVFFIAVVALWLAARLRSRSVHSLSARAIQVAQALALPVLLIFPFALMRPLLGDSNFLVFATMFALNGGALFLVVRNAGLVAADPSEAGLFALGAAVTSLAIAVIAMVQGTSLAGLIHGVFIDPLQHPAVISLALAWLPWTFPLLALATVAAALRWLRPTLLPDHWFLPFHAALASALAAGFLALGFETSFRPYHSLVMPLAWIGAGWLLRRRDEPETAQAVAFLALALLIGYLQSFPIAGSQYFWGSVLAMPLACAVLDETACRFTAVSESRFGPWPGAVKRMVQFGVAAIVPIPFALSLVMFSGTRSDESGLLLPFGLKGAERVRQDEGETTAIQVLTENASAFGTTLFSLPGMFSFNLWTGLPTPTLSNLTAWWQGLSEEQQDEIGRRLDADPDSVVIVNRRLWMFLEDKPYRPSGSLVDHIVDDYPAIFASFGFEFRVAPGRQVDPFWVVRLERNASGGDGSAGGVSRMRVRLAPRPGINIGRVEVRRLGLQQAVAALTPGEPQDTGFFRLTFDDGSPVNDRTVSLDGPLWLEWEVPDPAGVIQPYDHMLWFFDEHGECIARAVFNWR